MSIDLGLSRISSEPEVHDGKEREPALLREIDEADLHAAQPLGPVDEADLQAAHVGRFVVEAERSAVDAIGEFMPPIWTPWTSFAPEKSPA